MSFISEVDMTRNDFIVKILRIMTMSIDNRWKLKDIIAQIERTIETFRMIQK